jgi:hypothetical protein
MDKRRNRRRPVADKGKGILDMCVDGGGYEIAVSYDLGIGCEALEQSITIRNR